MHLYDYFLVIKVGYIISAWASTLLVLLNWAMREAFEGGTGNETFPRFFYVYVNVAVGGCLQHNELWDEAERKSEYC